MTSSVADRGGQSRRALDADFEAYVEASQVRHKRLAYLLVGDLHLAEDLLQTAYAKLYLSWRKVAHYDSPDAYLRRVMINQRTSWWRRGLGREMPLAALPERQSPDFTGDRVRSQALLEALAALPPKQRAAVVLRHWCDLSEAETAHTMGCSLGTVKSNTSRGLAHLKNVLSLTEGEL